MAGIISTLGIDWKYGSTQWDITPGKRAPMGCEISISFKPIHDITPGLDADGFNRAPVYGVGNSSKTIQGDFWETNYKNVASDHEDSFETIDIPDEKIPVPGGEL